MAAIGARFVTLADVAKSKNKQIGKVAEVLVQRNPMLNDIPYTEMNEGTQHVEEIRSSLPAVYYRKANQAIPPSKTTTEERTFTAAHFESKSQIDTAVARRGGTDRIAYNRWNQAQGHIQAHAIEHASLTIYGSPIDSHRKTAGLFDIYSTVNAAEPASRQVVDAGGTGSDNTSILLVHWGEQSIFGVYPSGSQAGLQRIDRSPGNKEIQIQALDHLGNPGSFWGFEEDFMIDHGLVVKDYRQGARIANIDVSNLQADPSAAVTDLIDLMIEAHMRIDTLENGRGVWYMNRFLEGILHRQARTTVGQGQGLGFDNIGGMPILTFLGRPVRRSDTILTSESRVV